MRSIDRVRSAIRGERIDRPPVFPIIIAAACELTGTRQGDYSQDPSVLADTLLEAREVFDFDGIYVSRDNWVFHQAFGGELAFPNDDEPFAAKPLLSSIHEFRKLRMPDPAKAPGMSMIIEAARQVVRACGDGFYVQANIDSGPFSLGAELMGLENFIMAVATEEPGAVGDFLEFCTQAVIDYGKAMILSGVHGIQYGDACASLIGPEMYREHVLPYQQRTIAELAGQDCDLWIHICGKTDHLLPLVATLEIDGFEVDAQVPLGVARGLLGDRIALKGNLDTTLLLQSVSEDVYRESGRILSEYDEPSGLIFSPGCGVPRMTPRDNLVAMVEACKDHVYQ